MPRGGRPPGNRPPGATLDHLVRDTVSTNDPPIKTRDRRPDLNHDRRHVDCTTPGCSRKLKDWAYTGDGLIICPACFYASFDHRPQTQPEPAPEPAVSAAAHA